MKNLITLHLYLFIMRDALTAGPAASSGAAVTLRVRRRGNGDARYRSQEINFDKRPKKWGRRLRNTTLTWAALDSRENVSGSCATSLYTFTIMIIKLCMTLLTWNFLEVKIVTVYNQDIFFLELGLWPKANEKNVDFITFYHLKKQVVSVLGRYYVCFVIFFKLLVSDGKILWKH